MAKSATSRFGEWLVTQQLVSSAQLDEALRSQTVYGGRLGTNLVEIGYLGLDELAEHLCCFHDLQLAPLPWLEAPEEKSIKLVPMPLIRRLKLLPLHLDRDALHVAMLDPGDPEQLEFVATAANRPVIPYVLPEIRLLYWLEIHLQIDRHPRYVNLAARLRRTDMRLSEAETANLGRTLNDPFAESGGGPSDEPQIATADQAPAVLDRWFEDDVLRPEMDAVTGAAVTGAGVTGTGPGDGVADRSNAQPDVEEHEAADADEELLLEELVVESEAPPTPALETAGGPVSPARVAELEAQLAGATERDAIVEVVLELARVHCEVAVLFLVNGGKVTPFRASGGGVQGRLKGLEVPLSVHSIFAHPAVTGFPFRGSTPDGGIDGRLLETLGRSDIHDLVVQPIRIRDRVVNLLYCDNGSSAFGETSVAALGAVADCAARAYERLILDRKRA